MDQWTVDAVAASRHLLKLYRRLGDPKQATRAIQAGQPAEERASRLALAQRHEAFRATLAVLTEEEGEATAWCQLLEALAGQCAFIALVEQEGPARGLQGARQANHRAFTIALQGYRTAFPEPLASQGITSALQDAAATCATNLAQNLEEPPDLRAYLHASILDGLRKAAGLEKGEPPPSSPD
ncbi:hypothetical protein [Holophaga foetida]|uniref:hypothetical protein n=1 Tax=Holophaga foetida TaxID=35839 RepID=UPI00024742AF|nr:hypothetical protein [Holophaga foetida]